mgnify:CR=1 FL=1
MKNAIGIFSVVLLSLCASSRPAYSSSICKNIKLMISDPVQRTKSLRREGCPVTPAEDKDFREIERGGIRGNVKGASDKIPMYMAGVCEKWEQSDFVGSVNGKPHFAYRLYVHKDMTVTAIERRGESVCVVIPPPPGRAVREENNMLYFSDGVPKGIRNRVAYKLFGSDSSCNNSWTSGPGKRFYQ